MLTVTENLVVEVVDLDTVSPYPLSDGPAKSIVKMLRCMASNNNLVSLCVFTHEADATPEQVLANPGDYCSAQVEGFLDCALSGEQAAIWTYTVDTSAFVKTGTGALNMTHRVKINILENP